MFTGLIQDVGKIAAVSSKGTEASFRIESALAPFIHGESIAVNGACLSVETFDSKSFSIFASAETLNRTGMKNLQTGTPVNLERAMTLNDAVGGHLVSGHVDTRVALNRLLHRL
jgi:riboflavin synthase